MQRTMIADTPALIGSTVSISGWVDRKRGHKNVVFLDLRDESGVVQVVGDAALKAISPEDVVTIEASVVERPEKLKNPNLITGSIELQVVSHTVLNQAEPLPIPIDTDGYEIEEEMRLRYRYIDLRRQRMQKNLRLRSQFLQEIRNFLYGQRFTEIETPILTKSTPEGSRDFLVPSRHYPGQFFALPQSPQQYKQLLMSSGFERYFQIARAIRDEDLRADRGYEHTQIDLEMAFVDRDQVMNLVEEMIISTVEALGFTIKEKPFPRISYKQAMERYGDDKFDLRSEEEKAAGILAYAWVIEFPFFEQTDEGGWTFSHNPFSMPLEQDIEKLLAKKDIGSILTTQYDLVCNGYEAGGGSIRAHRPEILRATYEVMGYQQDEIQESIGHMLTAFSHGTPPHGGIALGVERNLMNLLGEEYLREVVAFPMTAKGHTAVMQAPSPASDQQLHELGISIVE